CTLNEPRGAHPSMGAHRGRSAPIGSGGDRTHARRRLLCEAHRRLDLRLKAACLATRPRFRTRRTRLPCTNLCSRVRLFYGSEARPQCKPNCLFSKKSQRFAWRIFFRCSNSCYAIRYITHLHCPLTRVATTDAQRFLRPLLGFLTTIHAAGRNYSGLYTML